MINKLLYILTPILMLSSCGYKTPDCSSIEAKQLLSESISEKLQKTSGSKSNYVPLISIENISVTSRDEKIDTYSCTANVTLKKLPNLGGNLYKMMSSNEDYERFLVKIKEEYGMQSYLMARTIFPALFGDKPNSPIAQYLVTQNLYTDENKNTALVNIKKKIDEDISQPESLAVNYKVTKVENKDGVSPYLSWRVDDSDSETFDGYVMFIKFNQIIEDMY